MPDKKTREGVVVSDKMTKTRVVLIERVHRHPRYERVVRNVPSPADIGVDTKRGLVLVPLGVLGRVELWTVPAPDNR